MSLCYIWFLLFTFIFMCKLDLGLEGLYSTNLFKLVVSVDVHIYHRESDIVLASFLPLSLSLTLLTSKPLFRSSYPFAHPLLLRLLSFSLSLPLLLSLVHLIHSPSRLPLRSAPSLSGHRDSGRTYWWRATWPPTPTSATTRRTESSAWRARLLVWFPCTPSPSGE